MSKNELNTRYQRLVKNVQATYKAWQEAATKDEGEVLQKKWVKAVTAADRFLEKYNF